MSDNLSVTANYDNTVDTREFKFNFKTVKDKESGIETKRPTVELKLKFPSVEGIVAIMQAGGKQLELLQTAVSDIIVAQARSILTDNESITSDNFPYDQCTWQFIAEMPEAEKRGRGIAKELWEEFASDYLAVMPAIAGKSEEQVKLAVKIYLQKFQTVKTNKPVLRKLKEQLAIYTNNSRNAEQYYECLKFLDEKLDSFINADEAKLADLL